jgi:thiamine-phosphate pyrophosphorylase
MNIKKNIERFHFITQDIEQKPHELQVLQACKAGVKWVQLRIKEKPFEYWMKTAINVKQICEEYKSRLIINDNVQIARQVDACGVHLGQNDMHPNDARKILGENKIIGGTANTFEEIENHVNRGVDYVGLGPFRFTKTKLNLSPVIGLEGYKDIVDKCLKKDIEVPMIAIGGIEKNDINEILTSGMYGIAISSAISQSENMGEAALEFMKRINEFDYE